MFDFSEMKHKSESVLKLIQEDMNMIKTGRAKPGLIEQVEVEAYEGVRMPLVELASITAPDPHMLLVQPWDQSVTKKILSGLTASQMQLNPVLDGNVVRITIPPLSEERRKDLVKLVKQKVESGKEMLRGVRNDTKKEIEEMKDTSGVSEDDVHAWLDQMQKVYDEYVSKLDELGEQKETELMQI